jgi:hypothetical protein
MNTVDMLGNISVGLPSHPWELSDLVAFQQPHGLATVDTQKNLRIDNSLQPAYYAKYRRIHASTRCDISTTCSRSFMA